MSEKARYLLLTLATALALLLVAGAVLAGGSTAGANGPDDLYLTENVFIVSIDGIRNTEGFDANARQAKRCLGKKGLAIWAKMWHS